MEKREFKNWQLRLFNKDCREILCKVDLPEGVDCRELAIYDIFEAVRSYPIFKPLEDEVKNQEYEQEALRIEGWINDIIHSIPKDELGDDVIGSILEDKILTSMNLTWDDWNNFSFIRNNEEYQKRLLDEYINLFEKICYSSSVDNEFIDDFEYSLQNIAYVRSHWKDIPYSDDVIEYTTKILNMYWDSIN